MRVSIKNFQSIQDVSFDVEGFTVIVGENDIGKSSVYRSIYYALKNKSGKDFITQGTTKTSVTLEESDFDMTWEKPKSSGATYYLRQGAETEALSYEKIGVGTPAFLDSLHYSEVYLKNDNIDPHFSAQGEEPFLIKKSSGTVAEFFSEVLEFGGLGKAITNCAKEIRTKVSDIKVCEKELERLEESLVKYDSVPALETLSQECTDLSQKVAGYREQLSSLSELQSVLSLLARVPEIPIDKIKNIYTTLVTSFSSLGKALELRSLQNTPDHTPPLPETSEGVLIEALSLLNKVKSFVEVSVIPQYSKQPSLETQAKEVEYLILRKVLSKSHFSDINNLYTKALECSYLELSWGIEADLVRQKQVLADISKAEEDLHLLLEEMGECPLCGTVTKGEALHV